MNKPKLTPWFPAHVKPARDGWYEVAPVVGVSPFRLYWNNGIWRIGSRGNSTGAIFQKRDWRGLAKEPK